MNIKPNQLLSIAVLVRLLFLFIPANPGDMNVLFSSGELLLSGVSPFQTDTLHDRPPLFYYIMAVFVFLSAHNQVFFGFLFKFWIIFIDILIIVVIGQIIEFYIQQESQKIFKRLFIITPFLLLPAGYLGMEEAFALLMCCLAWLSVLKCHYFQSGIWLSIGALDAIMPIFYAILFIPYIFKDSTKSRNQNLKNVIVFGLAMIIITCITCLQFFALNPIGFVEAMIGILRHPPSIWFQDYLWTLLGLPPDFGGLESGSPWWLVGLRFLFIGSLFLWSCYTKRDNILLKGQLLLGFILPAMTFSVHIRQIYWIAPSILIISWINQHPDTYSHLKLQKSIKKYIIFGIILDILVVLLHWTIPPTYSEFMKYSEFYGRFLLFYWLYITGFIIAVLTQCIDRYKNEITIQNKPYCYAILILTLYTLSFTLVLGVDLGLLSFNWKGLGILSLIIMYIITYKFWRVI